MRNHFLRSVQSSRLVTSGLKLHLDPDDSNSYSGSGTTYTNLASGVGNGTINGPSYTAASSGDPGYFNFHGNSTWGNVDASINFSAYDFGTAITVFVFIRPEEKSTTYKIGSIFSNAGSGGYRDGVNFYINSWNSSNRKLSLEFGNGSSGAALQSADNIITYNQWSSATFIYDKSANIARTYHNTTEVAESTSATIDANLNQAFAIGNFEPAFTIAMDYKGRMGIYLIYNKALSAAEVTQNYNHFKNRYI